MKRLLIVLIFLLASSFTYQTEYKATSFGTTSSYIDNRRGVINDNNVTPNRIGYTTQYGTYNPSYGSVPSSNSGYGARGSVRRAPAQDSNGNHYDTPFDFDDGYEYYWDGKYWWRYHKIVWGAISDWEYWENGSWHWGWTFSEPDGATHVYEQPIGDVDIWFVILAVSIYVLYAYRKESRLVE